MDKDVLVHEKCLGVEEMVDDLKRSFKMSCDHRGVGLNNSEYFREYMFMLFSLIMKELEWIKKKNG